MNVIARRTLLVTLALFFFFASNAANTADLCLAKNTDRFTFPGGDTVTGAFNGAAIVGNSSSSAFRYPCTTAGVQAAISDAVNLANGVTQSVVDARSCVSMNITSEIDIGNFRGTPMSFYAPAGTWTAVGFSGGTGFAVKQFPNTKVVGEGFQNPWIIHGGANTNHFSAIYTLGNPPNYYYMENVQIYNPNGAAVTNGAFYIDGAADNSVWKNVGVWSYGTLGANITGVCCGATFVNFTSSGNWASGSQPLQLGSNIGVTFVNASIDHPGAGLPNIKITGPNSIVTFAGTLYMESSKTDTTTALIQITDTGNGSSFTAESVLSSPVVVGSTAYVIRNFGTSLVAVQSLHRRGNSSGTNAIQEIGYGYNVANDALGNVTNYSNHNAFANTQIIGGGAAITSSGNGGTMASCPTSAACTVQNATVLAKGSGTGNYMTASTTLTAVDATNLIYTASPPTGSKVLIEVSGNASASVANDITTIALEIDGSVVNQAQVQAAGVPFSMPFSISWVFTGNGSSHTFELYYCSSSLGSTATIYNSASTYVPTMVFQTYASN